MADFTANDYAMFNYYRRDEDKAMSEAYLDYVEEGGTDSFQVWCDKQNELIEEVGDDDDESTSELLDQE